MDAIIGREIPQHGVFFADVSKVNVRRPGAYLKIQSTLLPAVRKTAGRGNSIVLRLFCADLILQGRSTELLKQHHVDNLSTATYIQVARGATYDLDIINLVRSYSAELTASTVVLPGRTLAVNQYFAAATAAAKSSTTSTAVSRSSGGTVATTKPSRETAAAKTTAATTKTTAAQPGNSIHHVLGSDRCPFNEIGGWVSDRRFFAHIILGDSKRP